MATKSGKIQLADIKVGKTFYLVRADFPLIESGVVGNGEVEAVVRIRVTSRPFHRRLSNTGAFKFVADNGQESWINLDQLWVNHAQFHVTEGMNYYVVLRNHRAMERFVAMFDNRIPTKAETSRTLFREVAILAKRQDPSISR